MHHKIWIGVATWKLKFQSWQPVKRVFLQSLSALNSDTQKQLLFNWEMWNLLSQAVKHQQQELCPILGVSGIVLLNKIQSY